MRRSIRVATVFGALALAPAAMASTQQLQAWGLATDPLAVSGELLNTFTAPGRAPQVARVIVDRRAAILYDTDAGVGATLGNSTTMRLLPWLFRQEPSSSEPMAALGDNSRQRVVKIKATDLAQEPDADAMARMLREAIDRRCTTPAGFNTCGAHMVAIDEITQAFSQSPSSRRPDPQNPGVKLDLAMKTLQRQESPWGGSYASRVHMFLAPGTITSVAAGRGTFRTLGRDGKDHFRNYAWAMQAADRAGGAWMEMYHFRHTVTKTAFTPIEWRDVPLKVATFMRERTPGSNPLHRLHFVIAETAPTLGCAMPVRLPTTVITRLARTAIQYIPTPPVDVIPNSGSPMACTFQRAQSDVVNQRISANGIGTHRVSGDVAAEFGQLWRQLYVMD